MSKLESSASAVLIVEDDEATAELEKRVLVRSGLAVRAVHRVSDAIELLRAGQYRVVVLDYQLPDGDPWSVVTVAQGLTPRVPVIIVTAMGNEQVAAEALQHGVAEYLPKTEAFWNQLPSVVERVAKIAEADERVRRRDALFRLIADSSTDLITTIDPRGIVRDVSRAVTSMLGYAPAEVIGQPAIEFVHPDDRPLVARAFVDGAEQSRLTYRQRRNDGSYAWVEVNLSVVRSPATGGMQEVVGVMRDVTERKRAEEKFRSLLEGSPEAHVILDRAGAISLVNARSEQLFGYARKEMLGQSVDMLLPERQRGQQAWLRAFESGPVVVRQTQPGVRSWPMTWELTCRRQDGSEFPSEISLNWLETDGELLLSTVVVDLTERKTIQDQEQLLKLGQELPHFDDVESLVGHVSTTIGVYLAVAGCAFLETDPKRDAVIVHRDYNRDGVSRAGTYPFSAFAPLVHAELMAGKVVAVTDTSTDPRTAAVYESRYAPTNNQAFLAVPLRRDGVFLAAITAYHDRTRSWPPREVQMLMALAERTWLWMEHVRMLRALRDSEGQYRRLIESTHEGVWELDAQGKTRFVNPRMAELLGYSVGEMYGRTAGSFADGDGQALIAKNMERRRSGVSESHDFKFQHKDGHVVWTRVEASPLTDDDGNYTGSLAMVSDVTERKQSEFDQQFLLGLAEVLTVTNDVAVARRAAASRLGMHLGVDRCMFAEIVLERRVRVVHEEWQRVPGAPSVVGEQPLTRFGAALHDLASGRTVTINEAKREPRSAAEYEPYLKPHGLEAAIIVPMHKEGRWIAALILTSATPRVWTRREIALAHATIERTSLCVERLQSIAALRDFNRDLEQRVEERTSELQAALREKEVLLKEIHHRVKNNLQVISSMLNLQSMHLSDPQARSLLAESQGRVQSIALVHEALYQSKDLSSVSCVAYLNSLVKFVFQAQAAGARPVEAQVEVADVRLPVAIAIPCGLIVNELITNALKHAFPGKRAGKIRVALRRLEADKVELLVSDDGVGMPPGQEDDRSRSLGLELLYTFAEQLEASVEILRDKGTTWRLCFSDKE